MTVLRFVDTNILLYAYDRDAGSKHERAKHLMIELWNEGNGCLCPQVLQEFFVNVPPAALIDINSARNYAYLSAVDLCRD